MKTIKVKQVKSKPTKGIVKARGGLTYTPIRGVLDTHKPMDSVPMNSMFDDFDSIAYDVYIEGIEQQPTERDEYDDQQCD